jgi:hypothetical protein
MQISRNKIFFTTNYDFSYDHDRALRLTQKHCGVGTTALPDGADSLTSLSLEIIRALRQPISPKTGMACGRNIG